MILFSKWIDWHSWISSLIFEKKKWKIREIVDEILNKNLSIIVKKSENKTNKILINWFKFQNFIKKNEKNFYALFSDISKNNKNIFFVNIIKSVIFSDVIKLFIFFCYFEFSNVFEKKIQINFSNMILIIMS